MKIIELLKKYGFIKFTLMAIDETIHIVNRFSRELFYHWKKDDFTFKEAVFWSKDIDQYLRYSTILGELKQIQNHLGRKARILDVGAGGEGIAKFLKYSGDIDKYDIYLADTNEAFLKNVKLGKPVVIKGKKLPFKNNEFDILISVDTLEHIPKPDRPEFIEELKRVGNNVLLHFVMNDPENKYMGRDADCKFNQWYLNYFKKEHCWTAEHLSIGHPSYSEIKTILPDASIIGTQNVDVWYKYLTASVCPIKGFFTGFVFMSKWKQNYNTPPYHGCFVKWVKK